MRNGKRAARLQHFHNCWCWQGLLYSGCFISLVMWDHGFMARPCPATGHMGSCTFVERTGVLPKVALPMWGWSNQSWRWALERTCHIKNLQCHAPKLIPLLNGGGGWGGSFVRVRNGDDLSESIRGLPQSSKSHQNKSVSYTRIFRIQGGATQGFRFWWCEDPHDNILFFPTSGRRMIPWPGTYWREQFLPTRIHQDTTWTGKS